MLMVSSHHPASARRPASVIIIHRTLICWPQSRAVPGSVVASLSPMRSASILGGNPCASMIASVQPCGEPASSRSALRLSALMAIVPGSRANAGMMALFDALNVVHGEEERTAVEMGGLGERGGGHRLAGDVDTVLSWHAAHFGSYNKTYGPLGTAQRTLLDRRLRGSARLFPSDLSPALRRGIFLAAAPPIDVGGPGRGRRTQTFRSASSGSPCYSLRLAGAAGDCGISHSSVMTSTREQPDRSPLTVARADAHAPSRSRKAAAAMGDARFDEATMGHLLFL
jgi:hypothetical protein